MADEIIGSEVGGVPEGAGEAGGSGGGDGFQSDVDALLSDLTGGDSGTPRQASEPEPDPAKETPAEPAPKPAAEPSLEAASRAQQEFKARNANRLQLRTELQKEQAARQAQEEFINRILAARLPAEAAPEKPAEPTLEEDPMEWGMHLQEQVRAAQAEAAALRQEMADRDQKQQEAQRQRELANQQLAQEAATMRGDIESWDKEVGGFLTRTRPDGTVEKGIYDEWHEALTNYCRAAGMRPDEIREELDGRIRRFWALGTRTGNHPCLYLEDDAAKLGVRADAPQAQPQPQPVQRPVAQPQRPSAASQSLAAARAAQQGGVAGSVGQGAQGPSAGMPRTIAELMAANVRPEDVGLALSRGDRTDDQVVDHLLSLG